MDAKVARQLKINLGAVKRLIKEKASYEQEAKEAADNVQNTTQEPGTYEYKKLVELREEAEAMIKDCERRLKDFVGKLQASLNEANGFPDDPNVIEAKQVLESIK
ncbi:hypothetical protein TVAG_178070 [Trichomonas vaginalis G3]|uniref:Tubulin-specific chaperone A n=1 Tax=Trichomonas vaginalis (strain ATCC PRA-98 / G3) TaxID=412133 RepID=A2DIF9_TRIV3|nr:post-chaperonin tubulin folding pathway [Trichomonas vaginalis G3]EAY19763.1 hypothetical protein TVAG_178070 [Trichomonas vaginalis G3]KAI5523940.1 post-chaperonin tubulin folding pathway [Trichomonas vaginalis G3]|eukprot:XP_001580749.1 hypothetical protein [Trichomonas vaginalis G3]